MSSLVLEKLKQWGLDISNCRGQGYDGALIMSAQAQGVQGLIAQKNPKALCAHCTRWVKRHKACETFVLLLPSIVKTFEVILDEQQPKQDSTKMP